MKITVYKSDDCMACHEIVPYITKMAKKKNIPVEVVDVDNCGQPCNHIDYIPFAEIDGQPVDLDKLIKKLR